VEYPPPVPDVIVALPIENYRNQFNQECEHQRQQEDMTGDGTALA